MQESYQTADEIGLHTIAGHFKQTYETLANGPIGTEAFDVFYRVGEEISQFCPTVTIVCTMRASFMHDRHWRKVKEITGCLNESEEVPGAHCSFRELTDLGLYRYEEDLLDLCYEARKEHEIELDLQRVALCVQAIEFKIHPTPNGGGFLELHKPQAQFTTLEDNINTINRLRRSPHRHPFQALIDYWEKTLGTLEEMLEILVRMQSECRVLHELYRITQSIPSGSKMDAFNEGFPKCFTQWCELMRYISTVRLVEDLCPVGAEIIAEIETVRKRLNQQADALDDILRAQREAFPRFYLLSDAQLVALISAPFNYDQLEQSLSLMYENIARFGRSERETVLSSGIGGVFTRDSEFLPFTTMLPQLHPSHASHGAAETMNQLERHIREALQDLLSECHTALRRSYFRRVESGWLRSWPLQLCLKSAELQQTQHTRNALVQCSLLGRKKPLKMLRFLHTKLMKELTASAQQVQQAESDRWLSVKLNHLLIVEMNGRDLIDRLCRRRELHGLESFEWISHLQSYWHASGKKCIMHLIDARFSYGFECKGSTEPMLLTPISERARMATICALKSGEIPLLLATTDGCCGRRTLLESLAQSLGVFLLHVECDVHARVEDIVRVVQGVKMIGGWLALGSFERISSSIMSQISDIVLQTITAQRKSVTVREGTSNDKVQLFALPSSNARFTAGKMPVVESVDRTLFRPVHFTSVDQWKVLESWLWLAGCDHSVRLARLTELFVTQVKLVCNDSATGGLLPLRRLKRVVERIMFEEKSDNGGTITLREWDTEKDVFISALLVSTLN
uniref:Dynein heavy chain linker domain-containing protein n=1 Tax=Anopheles farauti TaxID=69004 RepID=A0A182QX61_9DIPT